MEFSQDVSLYVQYYEQISSLNWNFPEMYLYMFNIMNESHL